MVKLILVRHGYSKGNKDGMFTGHLDVPLIDVGLKQAKLVSNYILEKFKVDAIYSSPMSRSSETVRKVADTLNLPIILVQDLIEIYGGEWEGITFEDIAKRDPEFFKYWWDNKGVVRCPGGESMEDAGKRAYKALEKICADNEGKTLVIASHGGVIRSLQCMLLGIDMNNFNSISWVPNASISIIEYNNGKFTPIEFGITEHLGDLTTNLQNV